MCDCELDDDSEVATELASDDEAGVVSKSVLSIVRWSDIIQLAYPL